MAFARKFLLAAAIFLADAICFCRANFLKRYDVVSMASGQDSLSGAELERSLLMEIKGYMTKGVQGAHMSEVRKAVEPMWSALPKNEHGTLDGPMARYALHRFFVQRHGWHIRGLESNNVVANETSPSSVLKDRVPGFLLDLFKKALQGRGFRLDSLVVLASTLEQLIHDEATDRMMGAYKAFGLPTKDEVSVSQADLALRAYTASIIGGSAIPALGNMSAGQVERLLVKFGRLYPAWNDTRLWLQDMQETVAYLDRDKANPFAASKGLRFDAMQRVADVVSERFGSFQNFECRQLKSILLESEESGAGRVLLSDFYKKGLESKNSWYFSEPVDNLRQQGALDERQPGEPRVIVPNYIGSKANCLGDTGFYSICCINECDALLSHIERAVDAPRAAPRQLASIVANLSSSTVDAPRVLPEVMLRRLEELGTRDGSGVLLHSNMFAQWLHFAFPRECPSRQPVPVDQLAQASAKQSVESIQQYVAAEEHRRGSSRNMAASQQEAASTEALAASMEDDMTMQWLDEELHSHRHNQNPRGALRDMVSFLGFAVLVVISGVAVVGRLCSPTSKSALHASGREKAHFV